MNYYEAKQRKCCAYATWAHVAEVRNGPIFLCDEHNNRESVEPLFLAPYQVIGSY